MNSFKLIAVAATLLISPSAFAAPLDWSGMALSGGGLNLPESYVMMVTGACLIGFSARQKMRALSMSKKALITQARR